MTELDLFIRYRVAVFVFGSLAALVLSARAGEPVGSSRSDKPAAEKRRRRCSVFWMERSFSMSRNELGAKAVGIIATLIRRSTITTTTPGCSIDFDSD